MRRENRRMVSTASSPCPIDTATCPFRVLCLSPNIIGRSTESKSVIPLSRYAVNEGDRWPTAGLILGDMGADVIKVEPPDAGKESRMGNRRNGAFYYFNRNKRGIVIDLAANEGRVIAMRLILSSSFIRFTRVWRRPAVSTRIGSRPRALPDMTSETVDCETPARRATSMLVTRVSAARAMRE